MGNQMRRQSSEQIVEQDMWENQRQSDGCWRSSVNRALDLQVQPKEFLWLERSIQTKPYYFESLI